MNRRSAQSIAETVAGCLLLIPIVLFLIDLAVLALGNTTADSLAKSAARAAASARNGAGFGDSGVAFTAAEGIVAGLAPSRLQPHVQLVSVIFTNGNGTNSTVGPATPHTFPGSSGFGSPVPANTPGGQPGMVSVLIRLDVDPPVPFPGIGRHAFFARAVEPVVSVRL